MAWVVLVLSGVLEAVWATALDASRGFRRPVPTLVFLVAMAVSMAWRFCAKASPWTSISLWMTGMTYSLNTSGM